jgi:hypothetical protein
MIDQKIISVIEVTLGVLFLFSATASYPSFSRFCYRARKGAIEKNESAISSNYQ